MTDYLEEQEFYELMQQYRWSEQHAIAKQTPADTVAAYEAVKDYIRRHYAPREMK